MAYHAHRFGDPLTYIHAHGQLFHHEHPGLGALFPPDPDKIVQSIDYPLHEGLWLAAALLWFAHGHREALRRFPARAAGVLVRDYLATVGIATVGMMPIALAGWRDEPLSPAGAADVLRDGGGHAPAAAAGAASGWR